MWCRRKYRHSKQAYMHMLRNQNLHMGKVRHFLAYKDITQMIMLNFIWNKTSHLNKIIWNNYDSYYFFKFKRLLILTLLVLIRSFSRYNICSRTRTSSTFHLLRTTWKRQSSAFSATKKRVRYTWQHITAHSSHLN